MASVNKVILVGNVGKDPETRFTQSGEPIVSFSLATTETWKDKSGKKQEKTEWHRVSVFGPQAKVAQDYVTKGRPVYIEGSIHYSEYISKTGEKRTSTEIQVKGAGRLVLLASKDQKPAAEAFKATDEDVHF